MTVAEDYEPAATPPASARTRSIPIGAIVGGVAALIGFVLAAHQALGIQPGPLARALVLVAAFLTSAGGLMVALNAIWPDRSIRWKIVAGTIALVVAALLIWLVYVTSDGLVDADDPILGDVRIAVAPFEHREEGSEDARPVDATRSLAQNLANDLREELAAQAGTLELAVGYRDIAAAEGHDRAELEDAARSVDAHIVVYGVVETDEEGRRATMQPYVYVSTLAVPRALEIAGAYPLGDPVVTLGDLLGGDPVAEQPIQTALRSRVSDLARFARGLVLFALGNDDAADEAFAGVETVWQRGNEHLVTLMRGAVAVHQRRLDDAEAFFRAILDADPDNGRALLGTAEVMLQRTLPSGPDCKAPSDAGPDLAALRDLYRRARTVGGAPGSYVAEKSIVGESRVLLGANTDLRRAVAMLEGVVEDLDEDDAADELYMDALATRGLALVLLGSPKDLESAVTDLGEVSTNDPTTAAARWAQGQALVSLGRPDAAVAVLVEAIDTYDRALQTAAPEQRGCLEQFRDLAQGDLDEIGG
jgi:tetratricopeptide (TPR) repeat protein